MRKFGLFMGMAVAGLAIPSSSPAQAPKMSFAALAPLESGLWQLDTAGRAPQLLCLGDPAALFQVAHSGPVCRRFVIANESGEATVHYSCGTAGWGRTTVRVETPRLAQIFTQGIKQNRPFDYKVEARHVGNCQSPVTAQK